MYGDEDISMIETREKPIAGPRCPTLFDKWHGIFVYAQSHRHGWPGHINGGLEPTTYQSTVEHHITIPPSIYESDTIKLKSIPDENKHP